MANGYQRLTVDRHTKKSRAEPPVNQRSTPDRVSCSCVEREAFFSLWLISRRRSRVSGSDAFPFFFGTDKGFFFGGTRAL